MARGGRSSWSGNVIYGTKGNDTLYDCDGSFNRIGGKGDDTYIIDDDGDKVVEKKDSGTDHVISYVDYVFGNHVENLTLEEGSAALSGTGNDSDNIITGSSGDDTLDGNGSGAGGTVIGNLSNDDPDSRDSWTYTITQDLDQKFQIVGNQLVLRDGASLDYEAKGARSVTIRVTDCSGASHTETFAITFNDVAGGNSGALRRAFYVRRALSALVTL